MMKKGNSQNISNFINLSGVRWYILIILFSILSTVLIVIIGDNSNMWLYFRQVVSIPFIFFFPGYALVSNLYSVNEMGSIEKLALSISLSLIIVPSIGLLSNYMGWRINKNIQTYLILSFILVMSTISVYKTYKSNH